MVVLELAETMADLEPIMTTAMVMMMTETTTATQVRAVETKAVGKTTMAMVTMITAMMTAIQVRAAETKAVEITVLTKTIGMVMIRGI